MNERCAVLLVGPAGSGKTTLARALSTSGVGSGTEMKIGVIETGNLLEAEIRRATPVGARIKPYKAAGELVPSQLVEEVISAELDRIQGCLVLFDGFPRSLDQVEVQSRVLKRHNRELCAVIVLVLELEVSIRRLSGRRICSNCGSLYNIYSNPPKQEGVCDRCGSQLIQRGDDREELIRHRFATYQRETVPVINYFKRECPQIVCEIPADAQPAEVLDQVRLRL
jgi:adenylate kinase